MEYKYTPVCCSKDLILGNAVNTVIVTGWSRPESIALKLPKEAYASLGSLYSREIGIGLLLRNLIANPQINLLIALKLTEQDVNSGSIDNLTSFFESGQYSPSYSHSCDRLVLNKKRANVLNNILIDKNIPQEYLSKIKKRVTLRLFDDFLTAKKYIANAIEQRIIYSYSCLNTINTMQQNTILNDIGKDNNLDDFGVTFPVATPKSNRFPNPANGIVVRQDDLYLCWLKLVKTVFCADKDSFSRNGSSIRQIHNVVTVIKASKALSNLSANLDLNKNCDLSLLPVTNEYLNKYSQSLLEDCRDVSSATLPRVSYTYADRLYRYFDNGDRVTKALEQITKNPFSSTVIDLWDGINDPGSQQPPCLISIILNTSYEKDFHCLDLTAVFRSHDIYSAWYANAFGLIMLYQKMVSKLPDYKIGTLTIISQSAHIYSHAFSQAQAICDRLRLRPTATIIKGIDTNFDPCGNFIISLDNGSIEVRWECDNREIKTYKAKNSRRLYKEILEDASYLDSAHCFYLGSELQKAETALKLNLHYIQDRNLSFLNIVDRLQDD